MTIREWWMHLWASSSARQIADYITENCEGSIYKGNNVIMPDGIEIYLSSSTDGVLFMNDWYYDSSAELIRSTIGKALLHGKIKVKSTY